MQNGLQTGRRLDLISVHIPKTGGTIFLRRVLRENFYLVRQDYEKPRLNHKPKPRDGCYIVHGHFPASTYLDWDLPYIIWLRDPINRIVSNFHWDKRKHMGEDGGTFDWDEEFDQYIFKNQNVMGRYMDVPRDKFVFVGILELWSESIRRFGKLFDVNLDKYTTNNFLTSVREGYVEKKYFQLVPHNSHIELIKRYNLEDIQLYEEERSKYD